MKNWLQSRVFEALKKLLCEEAFLCCCCPFWLPRADDATTVRHRSLGHWSSKKAIRVFSRKGNYTQVSSKHARNLSLANFWISFFFALLPDALLKWLDGQLDRRSSSRHFLWANDNQVHNFWFCYCCPPIIVLFSGGWDCEASLSTLPHSAFAAYSSHAVDILHSVHSSQLDRKLVLLRALLTGPQRTLHSYKKG